MKASLKLIFFKTKKLNFPKKRFVKLLKMFLNTEKLIFLRKIKSCTKFQQNWIFINADLEFNPKQKKI